MILPVPLARRLLALVCVASALTACRRDRINLPGAGDQNADKYLFDRGTESLQKHHWLEAREYFRKLYDTYPTSPYRQDGKLGLGDSYLGEHQVDSYILAANEFREFLQFFPLNRRADYAQYKLAISQMNQMLGPDRDQTSTYAALAEFDRFVRSYPNSSLLPEVLKLQRQTRDALSDYELQVGVQYFRFHAYLGAISRLDGLLKADPQYTHRDGAYFYLAESYAKTNQNDKAIELYQKIASEFSVSDYLADAKKRLALIQPH